MFNPSTPEPPTKVDAIKLVPSADSLAMNKSVPVLNPKPLEFIGAGPPLCVLSKDAPAIGKFVEDVTP